MNKTEKKRKDRKYVLAPLPILANELVFDGMGGTRVQGTALFAVRKINLYRLPDSGGSPNAGQRVFGVESRADRIGSQARILDRIEPLTAEADPTDGIDCSPSVPRDNVDPKHGEESRNPRD